MKRAFSIIAALAVLAACRGHRETVTGDYGSGVVSGQIVMATGMANASPAGVRVAVGGTGMSVVVGADGRFAFAGVPDGAPLIFERQSDGVAARLSLASTSAPVVVELGQNTASLSHRGSPSRPQTQIEGLVTAAGAASLTVHDAHGQDDVLTITDKTVIRKGHTSLQPADLVVGMRVHVAADAAKNALLILVQDEKAEPGDDKGNHGGTTMTANGAVKSVGADSLVVTTVPNGDVTVKVDGSTIIKKQGAIIHVADIKTGDRVNTLGQRVDDHTELARQIEVHTPDDEHGNEPEEASAEGTVKSVGAGSLVVTTSKGDVTVQTDAGTTIRKQGKTIQLSDVKVGDGVEAEGQRVDAATLLARTIQVNGSGGHH